jgi:hypothetical protein
MILKLFVALTLIAAAPAFAQGQTGGASPKAPKPTKADVQKVVKTISGDKAKTKLYCDLTRLNDEIAAADEKKDTKKVEALGKQIETAEDKLGPDYVNMINGLEQIDPDSKEGKDLFAVLEPLEDLCSRK